MVGINMIKQISNIRQSLPNDSRDNKVHIWNGFDLKQARSHGGMSERHPSIEGLCPYVAASHPAGLRAGGKQVVGAKGAPHWQNAVYREHGGSSMRCSFEACGGEALGGC